MFVAVIVAAATAGVETLAGVWVLTLRVSETADFFVARGVDGCVAAGDGAGASPD